MKKQTIKRTNSKNKENIQNETIKNKTPKKKKVQSELNISNIPFTDYENKEFSKNGLQNQNNSLITNPSQKTFLTTNQNRLKSKEYVQKLKIMKQQFQNIHKEVELEKIKIKESKSTLYNELSNNIDEILKKDDQQIKQQYAEIQNVLNNIQGVEVGLQCKVDSDQQFSERDFAFYQNELTQFNEQYQNLKENIVQVQDYDYKLVKKDYKQENLVNFHKEKQELIQQYEEQLKDLRQENIQYQENNQIEAKFNQLQEENSALQLRYERLYEMYEQKINTDDSQIIKLNQKLQMKEQELILSQQQQKKIEMTFQNSQNPDTMANFFSQGQQDQQEQLSFQKNQIEALQKEIKFNKQNLITQEEEHQKKIQQMENDFQYQIGNIQKNNNKLKECYEKFNISMKDECVSQYISNLPSCNKTPSNISQNISQNITYYQDTNEKFSFQTEYYNKSNSIHTQIESLNTPCAQSENNINKIKQLNLQDQSLQTIPSRKTITPSMSDITHQTNQTSMQEVSLQSIPMSNKNISDIQYNEQNIEHKAKGVQTILFDENMFPAFDKRVCLRCKKNDLISPKYCKYQSINNISQLSNCSKKNKSLQKVSREHVYGVEMGYVSPNQSIMSKRTRTSSCFIKEENKEKVSVGVMTILQNSDFSKHKQRKSQFYPKQSMSSVSNSIKKQFQN